MILSVEMERTLISNLQTMRRESLNRVAEIVLEEMERREHMTQKEASNKEAKEEEKVTPPF